MTKFYATKDSEDGYISENADIFAFDTRAAAEEYLRSGYDAAECSVEIEDGRYGDCWIKCHREPSADSDIFAPFSATDCYVRAPGEHPGGRSWWVEPRADILVAIPNWIGE